MRFPGRLIRYAYPLCADVRRRQWGAVYRRRDAYLVDRRVSDRLRDLTALRRASARV